MVKYQEKYKSYKPNIPNQNKFDKGFSFRKSGEGSQLEKNRAQQIHGGIIDNYFFNTEQSEDESEGEEKMELERRREEKLARKKSVKKSAVFQS